MIHVAGEVDMVTGPSLEHQLRKLLATRPERLIVDRVTGLDHLFDIVHSGE
ncbi:MAG TPA: hypothetical protein VJ757_00060 [Pseudonocardiaceae bacterium]|nr:hypothetical protein [Pseudonocardiaceae bacterium]